jgi:hypothetical protein
MRADRERDGAAYPYGGDRFVNQWAAHSLDTPMSPLAGNLTDQKIEFYWRNDWFVTYLMWQSKRGVPSVPVALKYATWDWFGRAYVVSTSTSPWTYDGWQPFHVTQK